MTKHENKPHNKSLKRNKKLHLNFSLLAFLVLFGAVGTSLLINSRAAYTPPVTNRGAAYDRMGIFPGRTGSTAPAALDTIEATIGRQSPYVISFGGRVSADTMANNATAEAQAFSSQAGKINVVFTPPLAYGSSANNTDPNGSDPRTNGTQVRQNLINTANGAYDAQYLRAAKGLKDNGFGDAIIRIGHEFDGNHYPWSAQDNCDVWKVAYRHVHGIFKGVSPDFKFDYNGMRKNLRKWGECAYPGNEYVDIIGLDIYDRNEASTYFDPNKPGWKDPDYVWNTFFIPDLQFHLDFAKSKGKPISFPEWGVQGSDDTANVEGTIKVIGGDNPRFIRGMAEWMNALPKTGGGSLYYSGYFWIDVYALNQPYLTNSLAEFKKWFGGSATTTSPTPTPPPPSPTPQPDLIVTNLAWTPANPTTGQDVTFSATIKNQGTAATPDGTIIGVAFRAGSSVVSWSDNSTTALAAGASRTLTANGGPDGNAVWSTTTAGDQTMTAEVNNPLASGRRFEESVTTNNSLTKTLTITTATTPPPSPTPTFRPEDINQDGVINLLDFSILASDFGKTTNLNNPRSDINTDGTVNILDFSLLAGKFGS